MKAEKAAKPGEREFVFQRRESVIQAYCEEFRNPAKPWRARQNALFDESETILEQRYYGWSRKRLG